MKRVLVTGATGFIGRHCLSFLQQREFEIYAVSSQAQSSTDGVTWVQRDLLKCDSVSEWICSINPTHLLHLAWDVTPGKFWASQDNLHWLKSSIDLLQAFAGQGGKRVVMAGTCAEYDWSATEFSEKKTPCRPSSLYGSCKLALQLVLKSFSQQVGLSQAWGRLFYLYGPYEHSQRFIPTVINGLLNNRIVPCSHGNQKRDFLHVADVADAFVSLLDSNVQGAVNIGSGKGVALREVIATVTTYLGSKELVHLGAVSTPPNDPPQLIAHTKRLNEELKWSPKYTLEKGLIQTMDWWKKGSI